ncbi:hypothetical protein [Nocardiopsis sp. RV163]|uniref:hypothetical protein n=1 Tax=Nocardiopsis sp. RV163 TaxID=1661388 RepID=UPI00064B9754|nr:hypothetical protein [Nocardiopsis sp. RV163]
MPSPRSLAALLPVAAVVVLSSCAEPGQPVEEAEPSATASPEAAPVAIAPVCFGQVGLVLGLTGSRPQVPSSEDVQDMVDNVRSFAEEVEDDGSREAATAFADELEQWVDDPEELAGDPSRSLVLLNASQDLDDHCTELLGEPEDASDDEG